MRIRKLYILIAPVFALVLGSIACQTAQRPATLLPPGTATAPNLSAAPAPVPQSQPDSKTAPIPATQIEAKPDPVAELIAQVEKEYQIGQDNYKAGHLEVLFGRFEVPRFVVVLTDLIFLL